MTEQEQQELMSQPLSTLIQVITDLRANKEQHAYDLEQATTSGLKHAYNALASAIEANVDYEGDEELKQLAYNVFYSFLSNINKPYWVNPFEIKKMWDVDVVLNNESFTVTIEADSEEDDIEKVTENLEVNGKRQSFSVTFKDDDNRESMDFEFEGDDCDMEDDDCLSGIRVTAERNTD